MRKTRKWEHLVVTVAACLAMFLALGAVPSRASEDDMEAMGKQLRVFQDLLGLIEKFHEIAQSPSASGVAAALGVKDRFKDPKLAIDFYEKTLPKVKDEIVQRTIRIQLAELYKETGDMQKSMEQLEALMLEAGSKR